MDIGVPRETKIAERRVGLTPDAVRELIGAGHAVLVEQSAGVGCGFSDDDFVDAGATLGTAADAWSASLVVKVKEPQPSELHHLRAGLTLFTYLHLAAYPFVAEALIASGCTAIAYETIEDRGRLPLLAPMSEIAGRLAAHAAAHHLRADTGGMGILIGGTAGVPAAQCLVIGGGIVGWSAARVLAGMGGSVTVCDRSVDRLRWIDEVSGGRIETLAASRSAIRRTVTSSEVVIGAVLRPGERAPFVVRAGDVTDMLPGSVVIDVAIDQGGCIEGIHETTLENPTYVASDVIHYAVGNIPGAVPRTSTLALVNATLPYVMELADLGPAAARESHRLGSGVNVAEGAIVHDGVARALAGVTT